MFLWAPYEKEERSQKKKKKDSFSFSASWSPQKKALTKNTTEFKEFQGHSQKEPFLFPDNRSAVAWIFCLFKKNVLPHSRYFPTDYHVSCSAVTVSGQSMVSVHWAGGRLINCSRHEVSAIVYNYVCVCVCK